MMKWKRINSDHYKLMVDTRTAANLKCLSDGKWLVETNGDEYHFVAKFYEDAQRKALVGYMGLLGRLISQAAELQSRS